jgi:hypothetical protein
MSLRTATFTEPRSISDVLKFELGTYCRDTITIASGAGVVDFGTVLGKITLGAVSVAAKSGGNTGNGTFTLDATTPKIAGAQVGVYRVTCITAASDGGTFRVQDPSGVVLGDVAVAATFSNQINFVIADGAADFIVGDAFDVTVAAGSGKYVPADNTRIDGAQVAAAVLLSRVDATSADKTAIGLTRGPAEVSRLGLLWSAALNTTPERDLAITQLAALGIITRQTA